MIPKIIHWCWFSNDALPEKIQNCINSWKSILPDYEIKQWDYESVRNIEVPWLKQALELKEYAAASDYIRCYALKNFGGIYLDSDVEVLKSFNSLLDYDSFIGYEYTGLVEAAAMGCVPQCKWIDNCCIWYETHNFVDDVQLAKNQATEIERVIAPIVIQTAYEKWSSLKLIDNKKKNMFLNNIILPYRFLSPKSLYTGKIKISEDTLCVHHFNASWYKLSLKIRIKRIIHILALALLGENNYKRFLYITRKNK